MRTYNHLTTQELLQMAHALALETQRDLNDAKKTLKSLKKKVRIIEKRVLNAK